LILLGMGQKVSRKLCPPTYIQKDPEGFDTPLHFVFTGVEMTVSEANKERQRVAGLYAAVELGEQHFASSIQATVAQLFWHVWPALAHVPALQLNGYDDWYGRAASHTRESMRQGNER
jgi:hypothetical protein